MLGGSVQLAKSTSLYMESAHRNLSRGLNRLSTGVKLSTGVDDAGGLGVSMNIGAKLKKAFKVRENVQNARSFLEHQEAALSSMGKALDRMAELRTKYDDLIAGQPERELYNKEFKEMQAEMLSMRGRKFNGVSIFSTNPKDPLSFYIPTSDDGISTQVAISRTGFFDSLTIGSAGLGSTPATNVTGVVGTSGVANANATNIGSVPPFQVFPTAGSMSNIAVNATAAGSTPSFQLTPVAGSMGNLTVNATASGTPPATFQLTPVAGSMTASTLTLAPEKLTAGAFVIGKEYKIDAPGTTDFTLLGAANNTAGTVFTATGVGTGDGTADAVTTAKVQAVQGTGSHTENVTAFAGEDISIATTAVAGGPAAEIPAWTANPVTPNGNVSQQGVKDSAGNLWFVTDDGVVQKVEAGDPAAAGTGVLTTIPGISGVAGEYVSKPIILDVGGQEYMFIAGQNSATEATMHKIRLSDGTRQQFASLTGGNEKLKGLSEHNGKIYLAYSTTNANSTGGIARLNTAGGMSLDTSFDGDGRLLLNNGRDFGIAGAQVEIAFDAADNLYVTADRKRNIFGFLVDQPSLRSFDANGANRFSRDVGGFNTATGGLAGNTVHSPVVDGTNVYITLDRSGGGGANQIQARRTNNGNLNGAFATINFTGERVINNPVINGANLYVSTDQGKVHSYNKTTGAFVATFDSGSTAALTMPVFDGTDFFIGQANNSLHKVDSTTMTRDAAWTTPPTAAGSIGAPPLVVGNEVYVGTTSRVQGFEAPVPSTTLTNKTNVQKTPAGNDYLTTHSVGDTFAVTVKNNAGGPTNWIGTATVVDDGGVGKLNLTGFSGTTDLTGNANVTVVSPAVTPTLPTSLKIGSDYVTGDAPKVTVNKPGPDNTLGTPDDPAPEVLLSSGASPKVKVITQAMITAGTLDFDGVAYGASDLGKLDVDLSGVTTNGTGNYSLVADAGTPYLDLTHANTTLADHGAGYAAGETVAFIPGSSTGISYTGAATATVDGGNRIDVDVTGINPTSTGTLTLAFDGPLQGPSTLTNVGSGYDASETAPTVNITNGTGNRGTLMGAATINGNGSLNITFANNASAKGTLSVQAVNGTFFKIPDALDRGTGYAPTTNPAVTVTRGVAPGVAVPGITPTGTADAGGLVDITFSGNAGSATPVDVSIAPGALSFATTSYSVQGGDYDVSETGATAPVITITPPAASGLAAQTVNATVAGDGSLSFTMPTPNTTGAHTISAANGTYFKIPDALDKGTGYTPTTNPAVTVTRGVVPVAVGGITPTGTADAGGLVDITFTGNAGSATPVDVNIANGTLSFATTSYTVQGGDYDVSETGASAPVITITPPAASGLAAQTVNATVAGDGSLSFTMPTPNTTGAHTISAANGTYYQVADQLNEGSGYTPGDTPTISLKRGATAVAGLTANAVAGADGKIDITGFTGNAGNGAIDVTVNPGAFGFPTTNFTIGSGYSASDTPTITVTDPVTGLPVPGATATVNGSGALDVDISGVTPVNSGIHQISATNGTTVSLPTSVNGIGSSYSPSEPAPVVTVTDPASTPIPGATAAINANGTLNVNLTGVTPTTAGPYTVNVAGGAASGVQQGLDDTSKDLWDFSHADFEKFIQTLTDVTAVNGATTSSLAFSESRLETNIQNLELAGGRIVDADMAEEMVEVAKSQILLQTATDSLSKHNKLSVRVDKTLMGLSGGM